MLLYFRIYLITMAPQKRGDEEWKRARNRAEADLLRLDRAEKTLRGKEAFLEQEVGKQGRLVSQTRRNLAQENSLWEETRESLARARRAHDLSTARSGAASKRLGEEEEKLKSVEEALKQARVNAEVMNSNDKVFEPKDNYYRMLHVCAQGRVARRKHSRPRTGSHKPVCLLCLWVERHWPMGSVT